LELDLQKAQEDGRLFGILNGCEYPETCCNNAISLTSLIELLGEQLLVWISEKSKMSSSHFVAYTRIKEIISRTNKPKMLLTSVSRVTDQKVALLQARGERSGIGLEEILKKLGKDGIYIAMGSGDSQYEAFLTRMSAQHDNFIYLNGFSQHCAEALYASGDLFMMPSSFEPCGISQMLSMRNGQPCLVHRVGGLADTVKNMETGFSFSATNQAGQVDAMIHSFQQAQAIYYNDKPRWQKICAQAAAQRFSWQKTVRQYHKHLYNINPL
jgi:starch synthase